MCYKRRKEWLQIETETKRSDRMKLRIQEEQGQIDTIK